MRAYPKEISNYIREIQYLRTAQEVADMVNDKFDVGMTAGKIKAFRGNNKLNSGLTGRFEKGKKPWNKGLKGYMGANRTSFKKGQKPPNWKPIGYERITRDGYVEVKVRDKCGHKNYELKHRLIYKKHYGSIPDGHVVVFLDQDKTNFNIDNLKLVSRKDMSVINKCFKLVDNADLNRTIITTGKVLRKIKEVS